MKLVISLFPEKANINKFFLIYDTDNKTTDYYKFKKFNFLSKINRGMGMCYYENYFYASMIARKHRVGSYLVIYDINDNTYNITQLSLTKDIHEIIPYGKQHGMYNLLIANSTQTDSITLITTYKKKVITEDIYFDFLTSEERLKYNWNEEYIHDDSFHNNGLFKDGNNIYVSMFYNYDFGAYKINNYFRNEGYNGAVHNLKNDFVFNPWVGFDQPHSFRKDSKGDFIVCESGQNKFKNLTKKTEITLMGYTRGLCEDTIKKGYWIGISAKRKEKSLYGAMLQFVSYDMILEETIDLTEYGKEIFDIIEYKENENGESTRSI